MHLACARVDMWDGVGHDACDMGMRASIGTFEWVIGRYIEEGYGLRQMHDEHGTKKGRHLTSNHGDAMGILASEPRKAPTTFKEP